MLILGSWSLAAVLLAGPSVPTETQEHETFRRHAVALHVTAPEQPQARGTFQATQIADLLITACFRQRVPGSHVLHLNLYTPKGHLYQAISVPFTGEELRTRRRVRVADHPRPMEEHAMTRRGERLHVEQRFAVGGTLIVSHSLYGAWSVDAFMDGAAVPVARARFTLTP